MKRWQEIKPVLDAALERSNHSRDEFVEKICGADFDLRAQVEAYLKFDQVGADFLEEGIFGAESGTEFEASSGFIGKKIGDYKILKELGSGGMGVVFLAERIERDFEQRVALKLLGQGLFSKSARERFFRERKILASLRHKNIAAMIDGGTTPEGIPFLVMEYVEGEPLSEFVKKQKLPLEERLRIFCKICDAVSFAHRNLIIHRDLKPANILITAENEPKLLDFGIAKIISSNETALTQTQHRVFTPEYSSPEQMRGELITTATDIYSLGIVLYELLTEKRPFDFEEPKKSGEMWQTKSRRSLVRPSEALAKNPASEKIISRRALRGDLDTIVSKALSDNPEHRYKSVEKFAEDLHRFEKGLTVSARPETFFYRTGKFLKRNALPVGGLSLIFLAVLVGIIATVRQSILTREAETRAELRLANLRNLTSALLFDLNDEIGNSPMRARFRLAEKSSALLDRLALEKGDDDSVKFDLAAAYIKLGDLQGRPYQSNIGQTAEARASYRKSIGYLRELHRKNPTDENIRTELAKAHERLGFLLGIRFNEWRASGAHLLESIDLREKLLAENPRDTKRRHALADSYLHFGDVVTGYEKELNDGAHDLEARYRYTRRALELREKLLRENPSSLKAKRDLAQAFQRMAFSVVLAVGADHQLKKKEILEFHRKSLALREELADHPESAVRDQRNFADQLMMMSDFLIQSGDLIEAEGNLRRSKEIFNSLFFIDPIDREAEYDLGNAVWRLGTALAAQGKKGEAETEFEEARRIAENIVEKNPASAEYRNLLELVKTDLKNL